MIQKSVKNPKIHICRSYIEPKLNQIKQNEKIVEKDTLNEYGNLAEWSTRTNVFLDPL